MTRIGIALAAVLAIMTLTTSVTTAAEFKSSSSPVMLFGGDSGNHRFTVDGQAVTCNGAAFEKGSLTTPANTVRDVNASYNSCTAFGFAGATVNMGSCTYEFLQPSKINTNEFKGNVALGCAIETFPNVFIETPITIKSSVFGSTCEVLIHESGNTNLSSLRYENHAGDITVIAEVSGISVKKTVDNGLCPLSGTGTVSNGTYNGPTTGSATSGINFFIS
jgi:hypothetical protein